MDIDDIDFIADLNKVATKLDAEYQSLLWKATHKLYKSAGIDGVLAMNGRETDHKDMKTYLEKKSLKSVE